MSSNTIGRLPPLPGRGFWRAAQWLALVAVALLVWALLARPGLGLTILWNVAIPLLPASFLISPALWRNVCPLATLNTLVKRTGRPRVPPERWLRPLHIAGIALLALLVPARHFAFNTNGPALAGLIVAIALLALVLGLVYDTKSGFCNAICPVLPVERLYGQSPLLTPGNPRCTACSSCTARGCIDVGATKSIPQVLGRARRTNAWLRTEFGVFAAAFPGFVLGYYLTQDGPLASAPSVYATVLGWSAASWLVAAGLVYVLEFNSAQAMRLLGALAVGTYYWFAGPVVSNALSLPGPGATVIRVAAFALIGVWLVSAVWRQSGESARNTPGTLS